MATQDRRMSDTEALMWNLEKDPHLSSTFASVTLLDQPVDFERFRARMARAVRAVPRLRQRVVSSLGRLAPPEWHDDTDFDLGFHIRRVALPEPGTEAQLFELAAVTAQTPFDRTRPLWQFLVVDGLEDGRGALVQKMHHTITDGEGGVRMSVQFIDLERDPVLTADDDEPIDGEPASTVPRSLLDTATDMVVHNVRRQAGMARRGIEEAVGTVRDPSRLVRLPEDAVATARSIKRQVVVSSERCSPLWTERSLRRGFDAFRLPLADAKRVSRALGGSVNDLFVTGVAGAAGAYHRQLGVDVEQLRMAMPISTRTKGQAGGNHFTPTRLVVSTDPDPRRRFEAIREQVNVTKAERVLGYTEVLAGVANVLPTSVLVRTARSQIETVDFTASNVRGGQFEMFIAGARIEANYPVGPLAGTACNVTTLSYNGSLDMGIHVDSAAVTEPALLRACVEDAFGELLDMA